MTDYSDMSEAEQDKALADVFRAVLSRLESWELDFVAPPFHTYPTGFSLSIHTVKPILVDNKCATAIMLEAYKQQ